MSDRKRGGQSKYTEALGKEICERLANGESLNAICQDKHIPAESTVRGWTIDPAHPFAANYAHAREVGYLRIADELLEISDDATNDYMLRKSEGDEDGVKVVDHDHIARSRLRVETRKWLLSKMLPKVFGDKITQEVTGKDGTALIPVLNVTVGRAKS